METSTSQCKISDVKVFDDVFTEDEFMAVYKYLCLKGKWSFGSYSNRPDLDDTIAKDDMNTVRMNAISGISSHRNPYVSAFWRMELTDEKYFNSYLFNKIKDVTGDDFDIEMIYANGQTHGQNGSFHRDHKDGHTFLLYSNTHWSVEWGGNTVFADEEGGLKYVNPVPNRAVYFPGNMLHYAESPSRSFYGLRMTVAFKLFKKN